MVSHWFDISKTLYSVLVLKCDVVEHVSCPVQVGVTVSGSPSSPTLRATLVHADYSTPYARSFYTHIL